ncbi:MAG TPA: type II secretion system protein, partial [Tepidisphaeraceae bacterium]|nr:type II secretion system protein [Tepidisphaeraceae bacterium]
MKHQKQAGFTLVELLVTIGIIVILVSILVPTISRVRQSAYEADSRAFLASLQGAIEQYHTDFRAYPGPLPQTAIGPGAFATGQLEVIYPDPNNPTNYPVRDAQAGTGRGVTASENLTLGLLGGLRARRSGDPGSAPLLVDARDIGKGAFSFNPANPKKYNAYIENVNLSQGRFTPLDGNDFFGSDDTDIP